MSVSSLWGAAARRAALCFALVALGAWAVGAPVAGAMQEEAEEEAEELSEPMTESAPADMGPLDDSAPLVIERGQFGRYELRPAPRPYSWIEPRELDQDQREAVQLWEQNPFFLVWIYEVDCNESNYWCAWGPPPAGFATRSEIALNAAECIGKPVQCEYVGDLNPWPRAGAAR